MTPRLLKLTAALLCAGLATADEPELLNTTGSQLDTGAKRTAFRAATGYLAALNVADYATGNSGIPSDGLDDTAAFEACFADGVTRGIKRVYIGPGTWNLGDCDVPSAFVLFGASSAGGTGWDGGLSPPPSTRIYPTSSSATVFRFADIDGNTLEDLAIQYASTSATSTGYAISLEHATPGTWPGGGLIVRRCHISNFARGIYSNGANRIHIVDSHIVQCDVCILAEGLTASLTAKNSEFGGFPEDEDYLSEDGTTNDGNITDDGLALSLSNVQGASFTGCEFGNNYRILDQASGVSEFSGCNVESVSGPYAFGASAGRCTLSNVSYAAVAGALARNTGTQTDIFELTNVTPRSGSLYFDGRVLGYETKTDGDFPRISGSPISWRRMTSDFVTTREIHSARNPLPFGASPEMHRLDLLAATASSSASFATVTGFARGLVLRTHTTAGSSIVVNLSKGDPYAPVMARAGDSSTSTFDWSRRVVIRFKVGRIDANFATPTANDQAAVLFGVPYNRTTSGALADKGIGIQIANGAVTAVVHNGSAGLGAAVGSIALEEIKEIVLDYDGAGTLKASLTGHYDVTRSGGPTGVSAAYANSALLAAWNTTLSTADMRYQITDLEIAYY